MNVTDADRRITDFNDIIKRDHNYIYCIIFNIDKNLIKENENFNNIQLINRDKTKLNTENNIEKELYTIINRYGNYKLFKNHSTFVKICKLYFEKKNDINILKFYFNNNIAIFYDFIYIELFKYYFINGLYIKCKKILYIGIKNVYDNSKLKLILQFLNKEIFNNNKEVNIRNKIIFVSIDNIFNRMCYINKIIYEYHNFKELINAKHNNNKCIMYNNYKDIESNKKIFLLGYNKNTKLTKDYKEFNYKIYKNIKLIPHKFFINKKIISFDKLIKKYRGVSINIFLVNKLIQFILENKKNIHSLDLIDFSLDNQLNVSYRNEKYKYNARLKFYAKNINIYKKFSYILKKLRIHINFVSVTELYNKINLHMLNLNIQKVYLQLYKVFL